MTDWNPADMHDRAVLVTGGTQGIGRRIAETFLARGARVMVCARSEPAEPVEAAGATAEFRSVDIRDAEACAELVTGTAERFGGLDVLVNNAGGSPDADAATVSTRFVDKVVSLNLLAPFYLAQAAHHVMRHQDRGGCVINIGSVAAQHPQPGTAAYSAAKGGLLALTRSLALEWAPAVRVNHVTTGLVATDRAAEVYGPDGGASVRQVVPMARMATPQDVADTCLYLAGDLAAYVTGADIAVHGGGEIPARYLASHPTDGRTHEDEQAPHPTNR